LGPFVGLLALLVGGCSAAQDDDPADEEVTPSIYEGTWDASLDDGVGTFTFVVAGTTIESLSFSFSFSSPSCNTTAACPEGRCTHPDEARVSGNELSAARNGIAWYEVSGTFVDEASASGDVIHDASPCATSASASWTATRQ
jgi:hypothetical protein